MSYLCGKCGQSCNPKQPKDKGFVGICPIHNQDYRKCEECMPEKKQPENSWEEEFDERCKGYNIKFGDRSWLKSFIRQLIKELTGKVDNHLLWENKEIELQVALKKQREEWLGKLPKERTYQDICADPKLDGRGIDVECGFQRCLAEIKKLFQEDSEKDDLKLSHYEKHKLMDC